MSKTTNKLNSLSNKIGATSIVSSLFGLTMIVIFIMTSGFKNIDDEDGLPSYSTSSICNNPLSEALGYNAFVRYNTTVHGGDTEGPIALGGDLTIDGIITLAAQTAGSNFFNGDNEASSLVVNGKVIYNSGEGIHLNQGYTKVGDLNGSSVFDVDYNNASVNTRVTSGSYDAKPRVQVQRKQSQNSVSQANLIDFESAFTLFEAKSISYSNMQPNVLVSNDNKILLTQGIINVLNISGTELQNLPYVTFENTPNQDTPLIINVDASGDFEWNILNIAGIGDQEGAFVIWNFYNNSSLTLKGGSTIIGSLFAPKSDVIKDSSGNINGQVIAANYHHIQGELHQHVFDSCTNDEVSCSLTVEAGDDAEFCGQGEVTLTATISGESECVDCIGEYGIENTNNCRKDQDYVMWLTDGNNPRWFSNVDLEWIELSDGTATLTGTIFDHTLTQTTYEVNAIYSGRTSTTPANSPKGHECNTEDESAWIYYTDLTGTVTSTDGSWSIDLSRRGPAFQLGNGANVTETEQGKYGACGWFDTTDSRYNRGDFNFNLGDCVTTSTSQVSYLWSTGETTPSITVNEGGTYTVTVKDCENCEVSDSVEVVINDIPEVDAGEDQEICLGDEVTLTATTEGDESCESCIEYGIQNTDYCIGNQDYVLWLKGGRFFSNVDLEWNELADGTATLKGTVFDYTNTQSNYEVDAVFTGRTINTPIDSPKGHECNDEDESGWEYYTEFTGTITSADGSWSTSLTRRGPAFQMGNGANVTETASGKFGACGWFDTDDSEYSIGDFNFNLGDCITSETSNTSFLWSTGETTESIIVSPDEDTLYSVTVTNCNGCSGTDEVMVLVKSAVVDTGDDQNVCLGESITLSATGEGTFLWSTGETTETITVTPTVTTTYTVTATSGSCEASDSVIVIVNDPVIVDAGEDQEICLGEEVTLTAQASGIENCTDCVEYDITGTDYCAGDHDFVIWMTNADRSDKRWYSNVDLVWKENEDGTATLTGTVLDYTVTQETYELDVTYSGRTTTIPTNSPKEHECNNEDATGWTYYPEMNGTITKTDGSEVITITRRGEAFQVGNGANVFETEEGKNGASGWLDVVDGYFAYGDININFGDCITTGAGEANYLWSTGETTQSITVSPNSTTTYSVIVLLNDCEDTDSVIVTVNLSEVTANAGGDVSICKGDSITLTASGGTDYLWNTGETTQSILVNPNATTNYTVLVSNDISSDTDDVIVQVNPVPEVTISGDATILEGDYITLSASGANRYEWSNGAIEPNIAVSPSSTITYGVTGYINECYDVKDVTVNVVPQVVANAGEDLAICFGNETTLTATSSGGESYLWNTGETTESITVNPEEDTMYTVMVSNSLDSDADEILVAVNACQEVIIPEEDDFLFQVYTDSRTKNDKLKIKFAGLKNVCELYLFDISGRLIHSEPFHGNDGQEVIKTINTSSMSKGMYVVKINEQGIIHSKNIVIR